MKMPRVRTIWEDIIVHVTLTSEEMVLNVHVSLYIYKYIYIKEISKEKKNKTDFSQHSRTNVFTAVADLQVQCL